MTILSAYGLPKAGFYDWLTENGCGYSLRITPGLWMRSMVAEVYAVLPEKETAGEDGSGKLVIDLAPRGRPAGVRRKRKNGGITVFPAVS